MQKNFPRTLAIALLIGVCYCSSSAQCDRGKSSDDLSSFVAVFSGTLITQTPQASDGGFTMKFNVQRLWKGEAAKQAAVYFRPDRNAKVAVESGLENGEAYLVYAFSDRDSPDERLVYGDDSNSVLYVCSRPKSLREAQKELEKLGDGIPIEDILASESTSISDDLPIVKERLIRVPHNYRVVIAVQGPAGFTIAVFGNLPPEVRVLDKLQRDSPKSRLVAVGLTNGQEASFTTPAKNEPINLKSLSREQREELAIKEDLGKDKYYDFEIQALRVQNKPLTDIQDEGEIAYDSEARTITNEKGEATSMEISGLPREFKLIISWSKIQK
jgi:hypothetical protein